jgi:RNA ligase
MFPYLIDQLEHLRNDPRVRFKDEVVLGQTFTIVSYMIADTSLWDIDNAVECRGITYLDGKCVSVGFEKFFNYLENKYTQPEIISRYTGQVRVQDKRDGSMITAVVLNDVVLLKTKNSFTSDVAIDATANLTDNVEKLIRQCHADSMSPIFEYTSPNNEVVIDYGSEPKFVLLAIRNMKTGNYVSRESCELLCNEFNVDIIEDYNVDFNDILQNGKNSIDIEGWIIWFVDQGKRIKLKTDWYLKRHHAKTELRERDIADMVIDETIDDMKSFVVSLGYDLKIVEDIEQRVTSELTSIINLVEDCYAGVSGMDRKDVALRYKDVPHFGLLMRKFVGSEPDYKKFWIKNFRDDYSLKTVYGTFKDN